MQYKCLIYNSIHLYHILNKLIHYISIAKLRPPMIQALLSQEAFFNSIFNLPTDNPQLS